MTKAVLIGIVLLIFTGISFYFAYKITPKWENRAAALMLAFFFLTGSFAFIGMGGLPAEQREKAKECLDNGYTLILDDHEVYSGSIEEELDKYVVLEINDIEQYVYIKSTKDSPFSYE